VSTSGSSAGRGPVDTIVDATPADGRVNDEDTTIQPPEPKRLRLVSPPETSNKSVTATIVANQSFWESPEAAKLFNPSQDDLSAYETVERRIRFLAAVNQQTEGWRFVVDGRDPENLCTPSDVRNTQQRCMTLCQAYVNAKQQLGRGEQKWTWKRCCDEACRLLNPIGINLATHCETVQRHNVVFKGTESFPHPNQHATLGKKPEPQMFQVCPELKEKVERFCTRNVATLSIEALCDYMHADVIPATHQLFVADLPLDAPIECRSLEHFYNCFNLKNLSFTTVWRWMKHLGFTYDRCKKSFCVDGHERDDVVAERKQFCKSCLQEHEPRCLRWMQLNQSSLSDDVQQKLNERPGFKFQRHGVPMVEFHVDDVEDIDELTTNAPIATSVRATNPEKKLMIVGQDECVFSQHLFGQKQWVTPAGERPLMPKTEGEVYMLSALQSRDFGFGRSLTPQELNAINAQRRGTNGHCVDKEAALAINKTSAKGKLTASPFIKCIHVGVNDDGYWNSMHMALQLEDVADCLRVLYPDFEFLVLFDHSAGHDRKREGALDAKAMSKSYGGAQPSMRETTIETFAGCLGTHNPRLRVGDVQSLVFKEGDVGPFWMTPAQRLTTRDDEATGKYKTEKKKKKQLLEELRQKGIPCDRGMSHSLEELQTFARSNAMSITHQIEKVKEGWMNKTKGMLQVLWERGTIDEDNLSQCTNNGKNDADCNLMPGTSLRLLMANCTDFVNEETALQHLGRHLGLKVIHTPKFHAELAGEGIEHSWACAKSDHRRRPLSQKKGLQNFKNLVQQSCGPDVLTKERACKFSRRARAYICTRHLLDKQQAAPPAEAAAGDDAAAVGNASKQQALFHEIERLQKKFKTHRCALDFDSGFVNAVVKGEAT